MLKVKIEISEAPQPRKGGESLIIFALFLRGSQSKTWLGPNTCIELYPPTTVAFVALYYHTN